MKPFCGQWKDWMVLITSLGDQILTGGKLIRCTVDRNITCLQGEERREKGGWLSKKKRERGEQWQEEWEKKRVRPCMIRGRENERAGWWILHLWDVRKIREERRSWMRRKDSAIKGWFMGCLLRCDLRVKERLFVESLLAGNLLHRFRCHIVVARWSVYMLARGIKIKKCLNIYDSITMGLFVCVCMCVLCYVEMHPLFS